MTTHYGVAKDCFVSAAGDRATAERAIDAVLDAEADLAELPKDTFLVAEAKFAELYRAFAAEFAPEDAEPSLPRNASLTISKQQSTLRIDVSYE